MIKTFWMKIAYTIIIIISLLFSFLYLGEFSVLLLCILLIIPIFLLASLIYIKLNIEASIKAPINSCRRNKPQIIKLVINNKGFLPISKAAALIVCSNIYRNKQIPVVITFPVPARNITTAEISITVPNCGLTEVKFKYLQFTDYIRLFSKKARIDSVDSILTLPNGTELNYKLKIPGSATDEESNIYSKLHAGDDPSEVYRIREYRPGDVPKRIHWKLSSRTDTVWVKEYSQPVKKKAAVIIDYSLYSDAEIELMDATLEAAYSISMSLIKQEIPTTIYWISDESKNLVWNDVSSSDALNSCFRTLLSNFPIADSSELLKQTSDFMTIRSTNAIYYCTPSIEPQVIKNYCKSFKDNQLYIITPKNSSEECFSYKNVIYIEEKNLSDDLIKLSSMEVTLE